MPTSALDDDVVLAVAEGLDLVSLSDDELLIQFGTRSRPSELLRDAQLAGLLGRTVGRLLHKPTSVRELLTYLGPEQETDALALLGDLVERGVITDIRKNPVEQYLHYTFNGDREAPGHQIGIIGGGPLGARIAQGALQNRAGQISILDDRIVDESWKTFAPLGISSDGIGRRADCVVGENRGEKIVPASGKLDALGIEKLVRNSDFVVVALEQPDLRTTHLVNRFAIRERKPWFLASIDGNVGAVGPIFQPPETACYNDFRRLSFAATSNRVMARRFREHMVERGTGSFFPGLPVYADIVAGHATLAIVHYLLRGTSFALGRVMIIDFDRMQIDVEDVLKLPRCPVCGSEKSAYRPPFPVS